MKQQCLFALLLTSLAAASTSHVDDGATSSIADMYKSLAASIDDTDVDPESPFSMYSHLSQTPSPSTSARDSPTVEDQDEPDSQTPESTFLSLDDEEMLLSCVASMPQDVVIKKVEMLLDGNNETLAEELMNCIWSDESDDSQDSMESGKDVSEAGSQGDDDDHSITEACDICEDREEDYRNSNTHQQLDDNEAMSCEKHEIMQDAIGIVEEALQGGHFEQADDLMNEIWEEDDSALASHLCDAYKGGKGDVRVFEVLDTLQLDDDSVEDILAFYVQDLKDTIKHEGDTDLEGPPVGLVRAIDDYVKALEWRLNPEPRLVLILYALEKESEGIEGEEYLIRLLHLTFHLHHRLSTTPLY